MLDTNLPKLKTCNQRQLRTLNKLTQYVNTVIHLLIKRIVMFVLVVNISLQAMSIYLTKTSFPNTVTDKATSYVATAYSWPGLQLTLPISCCWLSFSSVSCVTCSLSCSLTLASSWVSWVVWSWEAVRSSLVTSRDDCTSWSCEQVEVSSLLRFSRRVAVVSLSSLQNRDQGCFFLNYQSQRVFFM